MTNLNIKGTVITQGDFNPSSTGTRKVGNFARNWSSLYTDNVYVHDSVGTDLLPDVDLSRNLGSGDLRWKNLYIENLETNSLNGVSLVPSGTIMIWSGSVASIPSGWVMCDGTNGTPDLRDRFPVAAGLSYSPGLTGGQNAITQVPAHTHTLSGNTGDAGSHDHTGTTGIPIDISTASVSSNTTVTTEGPFSNLSGPFYSWSENLTGSTTWTVQIQWNSQVVFTGQYFSTTLPSPVPSSVTGTDGAVYTKGTLTSGTGDQLVGDGSGSIYNTYAVSRTVTQTTNTIGNIVSNSTGGEHQHGYDDYGSQNTTQNSERGSADGYHEFAFGNLYVNRSTSIGGLHTHTFVTSNTGTHSHEISGTSDTAGVASVDTRPPYYSLVYVMKT